MIEDHKVMHCVNCPEVYCPECDFTPEHKNLATEQPGLCPLCLESSYYFFENMKKRYQNV